MLRSGSVAGIPLVPPSQPTQAPSCAAITGRSAVTSPPGESSQPPSPCRTGSRLAMVTTVMILLPHPHPGSQTGCRVLARARARGWVPDGLGEAEVGVGVGVGGAVVGVGDGAVVVGTAVGLG